MKISLNLSSEGVTTELLSLGIANLLLNISSIELKGFTETPIINIEIEDIEEDIADFLINKSGEFEKKKVRHSPGGRVVGNDLKSYRTTFLNCFHSELPEGITYPLLFIEVMKKTAILLRSGKLDPVKSLNTRSTSTFGVGAYFFITPSIIKQMEFYERGTSFLKPTMGKTTMMKFDPLWFSILGLGFMEAYAGFIEGAYYLITYPYLMDLLKNPNRVLNTLGAVTSINLRRRRGLESEEVYELSLSLEIANQLEGIEAIETYTWPLRLYKEKLVGRALTAEKSIMLDLHDLIVFSLRYINSWRKMENKPIVDIKDKRMTPLEALLFLADMELRRPISGDNEMLTFLFSKEIYKAISAGNKELMYEALYRLLRKAAAILSADKEGKRCDKMLLMILNKFSATKHLEILIRAIEGAYS